ncbi:MAG: hypothetical protein ABR985_22440, partial [Methanotrichaceae archaeon]
ISILTIEWHPALSSTPNKAGSPQGLLVFDHTVAANAHLLRHSLLVRQINPIPILGTTLGDLPASFPVRRQIEVSLYGWLQDTSGTQGGIPSKTNYIFRL